MTGLAAEDKTQSNLLGEIGEMERIKDQLTAEVMAWTD